MYYKIKCGGDNIRRQLIVLLIALAVTLGFSGAVFALPMPAKHTSSQMTVPIYGGSYHPKVLTVKIGATVTWANKETEPHTVTSVSRLFNSGIIKPGGYYKVTFTKTGVYRYYCTLHPKTMRGIIIVHR
ncbi:cupredoxin domain-containing protein [Methanobacterium sp.]|uniref:cupredoxin domain-containing protein n=1 Tax=Methanobacterium sp. TaxID=2164 RepID=UPI003C7808D3